MNIPLKVDIQASAAKVRERPEVIDATIRATIRQDEGRQRALAELDDPRSLRRLAAQIKDHTLQNLDHYLRQLAEAVRARGGHVHWATTHEQAREIVRSLARDNDVKRIVKAKSMTTEEIDLLDALEAEGLDVVETDLGEFIIQLSGDRPSHIVTPMIHKFKSEVGRVFADKLGIDYTEDPDALTAAARRVLRTKFREADMGICGVNFAVAETGTIVLVTNEGNGRLTTSHPKIVVAMMGIEKVIPRMQDLPVFLKLLARSATGQRITVYTSLTTGPRRADDVDGPDAFHLVVLDGKRSHILASEFRETLRCIRCGACLNTCPVYRNVGGHAYESVYPGPIGKLISPLLNSYDQYQELPQSSSLCGACFEVCPVMIDIPEMLIAMRNDLRRKGYLPFSQRIAFLLWSLAMRSPRLYRWGCRFYRWTVDLRSRDGWTRKLPGPLSGWSDHRDVPAMAKRSFRARWAQLAEEEDGAK